MHIQAFPRKGEGVAGMLGLQNQWGMAPKGGNFRIGTSSKTITPETLAMPQRRNYEEIPVQNVCFYLFHNSQNFFYFILFFALLKRGWRVASQPVLYFHIYMLSPILFLTGEPIYISCHYCTLRDLMLIL